MDNEIKWANGRNECKLDDIETAAGPEMPREINRNVCKKKCVNFVVKMTETADPNRSSRRWNLAGRLTFFVCFWPARQKKNWSIFVQPAIRYCWNIALATVIDRWRQRCKFGRICRQHDR